ncbi:MAG: TerB family tellurite resistance protein [Polyangiales bacterium]
MQLDTETLARLRDELLQRGARHSLLPQPVGNAGAGAPVFSADVAAVMQRVAPMCELLYLLMVADQDSDARERDLLRGAIRALTDGALRTGAIDALLARFQAGLEVHGRDARLAQVTAQLAADREDAEAAFTLAAVMVIADDQRSETEERLLAETRELLGISARRAGLLLGEVRRSGS